MRIRNKMITFRFTDEEYNRVVKRIKDSKMTYPDYFLEAIDSHIVYKVETKAIEKEIRAIGNNINQIARIANTESSIKKEDLDRTTKLLVSIYKTIQELKEKKDGLCKSIQRKR